MCAKCLRHVPDTIQLNGASTVWGMSHVWKPGQTYSTVIGVGVVLHSILRCQEKDGPYSGVATGGPRWARPTLVLF